MHGRYNRNYFRDLHSGYLKYILFFHKYFEYGNDVKHETNSIVLNVKYFCRQQVYPQKEFTEFSILPNIHDKYPVYLLGIHIHHFNGFVFYYMIFGQEKVRQIKEKKVLCLLRYIRIRTLI